MANDLRENGRQTGVEQSRILAHRHPANDSKTGR